MSNVTYVTEWMNKQTKPNYLPQHHILEHAQLMFFLNVTHEFLHPQKTRGKIKGLYILILIFLSKKQGTQNAA